MPFFFFSILILVMSNGSALVMLSTMVTVAAFAVLDNGLRSMVTTFFPFLMSARARSPSSKGTNTVSAEKMPSLLTYFLFYCRYSSTASFPGSSTVFAP